MGSRLAKLAQGAPVRGPSVPPAPEAGEHCDMCAAPVPPGHRHIVDLNDRRMLCACRACALLFDSRAAGGGHLRLLPTRRRRLDDFVLDEALLISRARKMREHWLVPIDDCYELVGLIRSRWRGFGGGEEVWTEIDRFFNDLPMREKTRW